MHFDTTIQLIRLALDASLMRQTAIANNIANSNTDHYKTMEVNFEQQFRELNVTEQREDVSLLNPYYQLSDHHSSIDEQMALSVANMTQYRALIKGVNQKLAIMQLALRGNNSV